MYVHHFTPKLWLEKLVYTDNEPVLSRGYHLCIGVLVLRTRKFSSCRKMAKVKEEYILYVPSGCIGLYRFLRQ